MLRGSYYSRTSLNFSPTRCAPHWWYHNNNNHSTLLSNTQRRYLATPAATNALGVSGTTGDGVENSLEKVVHSRRSTLSKIVLGDLVDLAKKRRKPDNVDYNLDLYKNYFVTAINERATVKDAVEFMLDRQVGSLFVVDSTKECNIKGFLSEHDIVFNTISGDDKTYLTLKEKTSISELMRPVNKLVCAKLDTSLLDAFIMLRDFDFRHIPVLATGKSKPTDITSIAHIISVKGLIAKTYEELLGIDVDKLSGLESGELVNSKIREIVGVKSEEDLVKVEDEVGKLLGFPTVKSILSEKGEKDKRKLLNTDIEDAISVAEAVEEMRKEKVGYVAVLDFSSTHEPYLLGLITERDFLSRVLAEDKLPSKTQVKEVMTKSLTTKEDRDKMKLCNVTSSKNMLTCMRLMTSYDVRHLPVMSSVKFDEEGKLLSESAKRAGVGRKITGMITSKDIVDVLCNKRAAFTQGT